jgi:predicted benzoate:H+ symporter BenE
VLILCYVDRYTSAAYSGSAYGIRGYFPAALVAVRVSIPHVSSVVAVRALLFVFLESVSRITAAVGRYGGWD